MLVRALVLVAAILMSVVSVQAQPNAPLPSSPPEAPRELVIGTRTVPPFAFKGPDGEWTGISIELWRQIAKSMNLEFRFEDAGAVKDLVDGVTSRKFDAGVAALTVTEERERSLDFSHPFFSTGLAIAAQPVNTSPVWQALRSFFTWESLVIVAAVIAGVLLVGYLLKYVEARKGNGDFDQASEGVWGALTMFLTSQFTAPEPKSAMGRALATAWVIVSIGAMTFLTGVVTSALTVQSLEGRVRGLADLPRLRVGAVAGSTGAQFLTAERIRATGFENVAEGLKALAEDRIDAFVHDAPVLQYLAKTEYEGRVMVLPENFAPQDYAIAFPDGSPLREAVNRELIAIKRSDAWKQRVFDYLGER
jgi:ABC-type amino acid transport substrate-binding protein